MATNPDLWLPLGPNDPHYDGTRHSTLTIIGVTVQDRGNYRVLVANGCGTTESAVAELILDGRSASRMSRTTS